MPATRSRRHQQPPEIPLTAHIARFAAGVRIVSSVSQSYRELLRAILPRLQLVEGWEVSHRLVGPNNVAFRTVHGVWLDGRKRLIAACLVAGRQGFEPR